LLDRIPGPMRGHRRGQSSGAKGQESEKSSRKRDVDEHDERHPAREDVHDTEQDGRHREPEGNTPAAREQRLQPGAKEELLAEGAKTDDENRLDNARDQMGREDAFTDEANDPKPVGGSQCQKEPGRARENSEDEPKRLGLRPGAPLEQEKREDERGAVQRKEVGE